MSIVFSKYQGLGNDFILIDGAYAAEVGPELAKALCDRHFGIGADGVLFSGLRDGAPFMQVINADGSTPEMCGNGLRCAALYLHHQGIVRGTSFEVQTDAGPHLCELTIDGEAAQVSVQMPPASLDATSVLREAPGSFVEQGLPTDGHALRATAVSMGNPHLVLFDVDPAIEDALGPLLTSDPRTRSGANVGFAQMRGPGEMRLRVHERGAAWTYACGTGACAAAVAAIETGRAPRGEPLQVHLPGGALRIRVGEPGAPIEMRGPARRVFEGSLRAWPQVAHG